MKIRMYYLYCLLCILPLAACDIHQKIMGDGYAAPGALYGSDVGAQYGSSDASAQYGTNAAAQYGSMSGGGNDAVLYGAPAATNMQYANKSDYVAPKNMAPETKPATPIPQPAPTVTQPPTPSPVASTTAEPDDVLLVPARIAAADKKVEVVAPTVGEITVARGDTVYGLSRKHDVPLRDLLDANNLKPPYAISPGQKLKLPGARYHTVVAGDTLYSISRAYSVDLNSLARENNIAAPYGLVVGQKLRLPASVVMQSTPAVAAVTTLSPTVTAPTAPPAMPVTPAAPGAKPTTSTPPPPTPAAPTVSAPQPKITSTTSSGAVAKLPAANARTSTKFSWPVQGKIISDFGAKKNGLYNDGINIGASVGTTVRAAENGVVAYAGNELKGMGNLVIIQHTGGWMTVYAHMETMTVRRGAKVSVGEKIGTVGKTGKVSESQLHFEIRNGTKAYNPKTQLK